MSHFVNYLKALSYYDIFTVEDSGIRMEQPTSMGKLNRRLPTDDNKSMRGLTQPGRVVLIGDVNKYSTVSNVYERD